MFREPVMHLFSSDSSVSSIGIYFVAAMLISALFNGFTGLFTSVFQAIGQGMPTMVMSVTQGVLYIPVIVILHCLFRLHGVVWSMTVTEVITCLMGILLFILLHEKMKG
ncbi:MATE family efflux transporter [Paenibacillus brasilensis]|uniref:MATE family efflux transporter n=1 Tax=Paenibacillus brasilensis TaxID=128574 RepID=UPI003CC6FD00